MFSLRKKKQKNQIIDKGENNNIFLDTLRFKSSTALLNGNGNHVKFSDCDINNTCLSVIGDSNKLTFSGSQLNNSFVNINGNNNTIVIGQGSSIACMELVINGNNHQLFIGEYVQVTGKLAFWFEDSENQIVIGKYSTFGITNIAIAEPQTKILIGDDCMFANGVSVKNSDFHSIIDIHANQRINPSANVVIGNHVWLGEQCHVLKNVTIHDNSIVALGSIVTKDVPSNCVVAGNPIKVIKENVTWTRERII